MTRLRILLPPIAACSRAPDNIQHGRWEYEVVTTSIDAPGLPAEAQQQARAALNQPQFTRECVTPENAANPLRRLRDQMAGSQAVTCQTTDDVFSRGLLRFSATCRSNAGAPGQLQFTLDGRFEAITLLATISVNAEVPSTTGSGTQTVRTAGTVRGRRVGDCPRS